MSSRRRASTLTVRDVDVRLRRSLEQEAARRRLSLNRTVLALLGEATGSVAVDRPRAVEHHDLDALAGTWSEGEAREFEAALQAQRSVEPALWR